MLISPGEVVDVPVPPLDDSQLLSYRIRCEDGLDIGFEVLCLEGGGAVAAELPLEAWRRGDEFDGELRLKPAVRCVVRFDNSFSFLREKQAEVFVLVGDGGGGGDGGGQVDAVGDGGDGSGD